MKLCTNPFITSFYDGKATVYEIDTRLGGKMYVFQTKGRYSEWEYYSADSDKVQAYADAYEVALTELSEWMEQLGNKS